MISKALFKREVKANRLIFVIIAAVQMLYVFPAVMMYDPKMGEMIGEFEKLMPEMMSAMGMSGLGSTLIETVASFLYGMILLLLPLVFELVLCSRLVAKYIDTGSMAYLLATPNKRIKIIFTQLSVLLVGIILMIAALTATVLVSCQALYPSELDIERFLMLNIGLLTFHIFTGGICFLTACLVNDCKQYYSIAGGITVGFYVIKMVANLGGDLDGAKYFTYYTLFDSAEIARGNMGIGIFVLLAAGIALMAIGCAAFGKREFQL